MNRQTITGAVLFADITGSTSMYDMLGDHMARRRVADCISTLANITQRHDGTIIKTLGDQLMCTFCSADNAIEAACDMQKFVNYDTVDEGGVYAIRVGIHFGKMLREGGDVFGDVVNLANVMMSTAKSHQIITTDQTIVALEPFRQANARQIDCIAIKGRQREIGIFEVLWKNDDVTPLAWLRHEPTIDTVARVFLRYRDHEVEIDRERPVLVMGRAQRNGLVVLQGNQSASREHARIEYRRGKFVLIDISTNGTYVASRTGGIVSLRRGDTLPLRGSGVIGLGQAYSEDAPEAIHFSCHLSKPK